MLGVSHSNWKKREKIFIEDRRGWENTLSVDKQNKNYSGPAIRNHASNKRLE